MKVKIFSFKILFLIIQEVLQIWIEQGVTLAACGPEASHTGHIHPRLMKGGKSRYVTWWRKFGTPGIEHFRKFPWLSEQYHNRKIGTIIIKSRQGVSSSKHFQQLYSSDFLSYIISSLKKTESLHYNLWSFQSCLSAFVAFFHSMAFLKF